MAVATPRIGVVRVGLVAKTNKPLPVSSESADEIPADVVSAVNADVPLPSKIPVNVLAPVPPLPTVKTLVVNVKEPKLPTPVVVTFLAPKSTAAVAPV